MLEYRSTRAMPYLLIKLQQTHYLYVVQPRLSSTSNLHELAATMYVHCHSILHSVIPVHIPVQHNGTVEWNGMKWWGGKWYGMVNVHSYI